MNSSSPNPTTWWLSTGDQPEGPFSTELIATWLQNGQIAADVLACPAGGNDWKPLNKISGFGPSHAPIPPDAPQPPHRPEVPRRPEANQAARSIGQGADPVSVPTADPSPLALYRNLPWYRKSSLLSLCTMGSLFAIFGMGSPYGMIISLVGFILIIIICVTLVTGNVYYRKIDKLDGSLKKWSEGNRIVAGILLVVYVVAIVRAVMGK